MEFQSLAEFTNRFFEKEFSSLDSHYPGITIKRIISELKSLSSLYSSYDIHNTIYFDIPGSVYSDFFESLKKGIPLEYITNKAYFYKSEFAVGPEVLIPRSETEILVEHLVDLVKKIHVKNKIVTPLICDVGTGSGAIALSLLSDVDFPIDVIATDISEQALEIAKRNYFLQQFKINKDSKLSFKHADRLLGVSEKFHLIASNPPYIKKESDSLTVHKQVTSFEPHLALFLEDEVYESWFHEFFSQAENSLLEGGVFFMEGHEEHLEMQAKQLQNFSFTNIEIIKDYTNRNRFLKGIKKCKN